METHFPPKTLSKTFKITSLVVLLVFIYAIVRYNVIKGVPWSDLPLFISNKAFALGAVVLISLAIIIGPFGKWWPKSFIKHMALRKTLGLLGFGFAAIHAVISLIIFSPEYYPKFFESSGKLNLIGELSMLFGVLGLFVFSLVAIASLPPFAKSLGYTNWKRVQRFGYLAFFFVFLHVFVMGFKGWLTPEHWPGGLLPISLVAFIIILLAFLIRILAIFTKEKTDSVDREKE